MITATLETNVIVWTTRRPNKSCFGEKTLAIMMSVRNRIPPYIILIFDNFSLINTTGGATKFIDPHGFIKRRFNVYQSN